jgi:hypothetical protein
MITPNRKHWHPFNVARSGIHNGCYETSPWIIQHQDSHAFEPQRLIQREKVMALRCVGA